MADLSFEGFDVGAVALADAVGVAEALAGAGEAALLADLAERMLPRLIKKERFAEVEGVWIACCTSGTLPLAALLRAAKQIASHGEVGEASDLVVMLAETLAEAARGEEALDVFRQGLGWAATAPIRDAAAALLARAFPEASNLAATLAALRRAEASADAFAQAERALRFAPGAFLLWPDHMIAQVASNDGAMAQVRHPSGAIERRAVDAAPPPKVLPASNHEVRRLFALEQLRADWIADPLSCLVPLLREQEGALTVSSINGILVPRIVSEPQFEAILARLKVDCGLGHTDRPVYHSRHRIFSLPGVELPEFLTKPVEPRPAAERRPARSAPPPRPAAAAPKYATTSEPVDNSRPARWVDLTQLPEVRGLIAHVEGEVAELTRELNAELPVRLEEARAHGDLRENAEYDAAKERLRFVQARIGQLQDFLGKLHDLSRVRVVPGRVTAMSRVVVSNEETGEERTLRLVPAELRDPKPGDVSMGTPYAKALLGRDVGATVVVKLPRRTERLEVLRVIDPGE
jgi:transcription elongation factor GreA